MTHHPDVQHQHGHHHLTLWLTMTHHLDAQHQHGHHHLALWLPEQHWGGQVDGSQGQGLLQRQQQLADVPMYVHVKVWGHGCARMQSITHMHACTAARIYTWHTRICVHACGMQT